MVNIDCDYITTLLLCLFLGPLAGHRWYARKYGTAVLQILLWCCCGLGVIWYIIDLVSIVNGNFTTKEGNRLINHPRW